MSLVSFILRHELDNRITADRLQSWRIDRRHRQQTTTHIGTFCALKRNLLFACTTKRFVLTSRERGRTFATHAEQGNRIGTKYRPQQIAGLRDTSHCVRGRGLLYSRLSRRYPRETSSNLTCNIGKSEIILELSNFVIIKERIRQVT